MGPSVKFVSAIKDVISKKNGDQFFSGKRTMRGGGSEREMAKDHTFPAFFLTLPLLEILRTTFHGGDDFFLVILEWNKPHKFIDFLES